MATFSVKPVWISVSELGICSIAVFGLAAALERGGPQIISEAVTHRISSPRGAPPHFDREGSDMTRAMSDL